jgi:23S rRNA (uridine2552-2'-O)-methyltransferase
MVKKTTSGRGERDLRVRVKTARGRKLSSTRWLERQLNDPYVRRAKAEGYRGRAAYKILELDDRFRFLVPGARVVDLGCAPGGWCQVAVERVNALGAKAGQPVGRSSGSISRRWSRLRGPKSTSSISSPKAPTTR